jgi:hypothetical protein
VDVKHFHTFSAHIILFSRKLLLLPTPAQAQIAEKSFLFYFSAFVRVIAVGAEPSARKLERIKMKDED